MFLDRSCAILSSFKIVVIFSNTSADFVLISANVLLKMTTILKELRIEQLLSENKRTLVLLSFHEKQIEKFNQLFRRKKQTMTFDLVQQTKHLKRRTKLRIDC